MVKIIKMSTRDIFTLSKAIIEKYPEVLEYARTTVLEQPARNFKKREHNSSSWTS